MNAVTDLRKTPLAGALIIGGVLLFAGTACHKADSDDAAANTPPAASTAANPGDATTPTTAGNASGGMANDATGSSATPSAAGANATGSTASDMSGASATGSGAATPASGGDNASAMASGPVTDTQFYTEAMTGDQKEIATAKMVASQSTNADVKRVASKIASDHQALDAQVKSAAGSSATPPAATGTAAVDPSLQGKTGKDLDRAFADAMVADHQKDIPMFENVSKNGSTAQAKKLATQALPKLRDHLKLAQDLQKKLASG